jgi:hypothetical protein
VALEFFVKKNIGSQAAKPTNGPTVLDVGVLVGVGVRVLVGVCVGVGVGVGVGVIVKLQLIQSSYIVGGIHVIVDADKTTEVIL